MIIIGSISLFISIHVVELFIIQPVSSVMIEQLSPINNDSALTCACQDLHKLITKINSLCTELQAINSSIFQIETEDEELKQKMLERRRTVEEVSEVIDRLSIPGELVISINSKRISDEFEAALPALNEKVQYCRKAISNGVLCANDVWTVLEPLLNSVLL